MTYHLERTLPVKTNMFNENLVDRNVLFPEKLWDALDCESRIFRWTDDGKGVVVNVDVFEESVIETFPGLVQIAQFQNFRRQMRWYGFAWEQKSEAQFLFSHPCFVRNRKDLCVQVTARKRPLSYDTVEHVPRRRGRPPASASKCDSSQAPLRKKRKYVRRKLVSAHLRPNDVDESSNGTGSLNAENAIDLTIKGNSGSQTSEVNVLVELEAIGIELMSLRRMLEWVCVKVANRVPTAEELFSLPSVITTDTFVTDDILSESDVNSQLSSIVLAQGVPFPPALPLMSFGLNNFNTADSELVDSQDNSTKLLLDANLNIVSTFDSI